MPPPSTAIGAVITPPSAAARRNDRFHPPSRQPPWGTASAGGRTANGAFVPVRPRFSPSKSLRFTTKAGARRVGLWCSPVHHVWRQVRQKDSRPDLVLTFEAENADRLKTVLPSPLWLPTTGIDSGGAYYICKGCTYAIPKESEQWEKNIFNLKVFMDQYGSGWGNINTLTVIDWSWIPLAVLNPIRTSRDNIPNSFFVSRLQSGRFWRGKKTNIWRIWEVSKRLWLCVIIGLVMLTQVTAGCYYGIVLAIEDRGLDKLLALSTEIALAAIASAVTDILITVSLVWTFSGLKHQTRVQQTRGIINRLIRFSEETGAVTTTADTIHVVLFLILGKFYSNVLMATLNCRTATVRRELETGMASLFWVENNPTGVLKSSRGEYLPVCACAWYATASGDTRNQPEVGDECPSAARDF
ncbi:hypothetical protein DFH06DRAFT_1150870 [Mycena polygramma]|nr:hypothetical protein DFH06DRAFT_1150870 [Mycena polygramma]